METSELSSEHLKGLEKRMTEHNVIVALDVILGTRQVINLRCSNMLTFPAPNRRQVDVGERYEQFNKIVICPGPCEASIVP